MRAGARGRAARRFAPRADSRRAPIRAARPAHAARADSRRAPIRAARRSAPRGPRTRRASSRTARPAPRRPRADSHRAAV
jgi:hypothetical protein